MYSFCTNVSVNNISILINKQFMETTLILAIVIAISVFGLFFLLKSVNNLVRLIIYGCVACFFLVYFIIKKEYPSLLFTFIALVPIIKYFYDKRIKKLT